MATDDIKMDGSTTLDPRLLFRIQSYHAGSKVFTLYSKLLFRIQSDYSWSKLIIPGPKLLSRIQSYYSGSKVITLDPKLLLWIQSPKFFEGTVSSAQCEIRRLNWALVLPLFVIKLAGTTPKRPKMLRKHHKFRQGHKVKITRFWPLNKDRLNLHTNPYIISVTQQRFSLLSLGYLWKHFFIVVLVCMFLLCSLDCKTVRIFAYSSTHEQSNKGSGTTLKTESKRLLRHALPIYFTHFAKKKPTVLQSICSLKFFSACTYTYVSIIPKEVALRQERQESKSWILDSALWIPDYRYLVPDFLSYSSC